MSIKIPKYVIQEAKGKTSFIRRHWLMFSLLGLAILTFLFGRYSNVDMLNAFKGQKKTWVELNQQLTDENTQLNKTVSLLRTEAKVKEQAIKELQQSIVQTSNEKDDLKAELAFYENLLSHKDDIKKLRVFEVDVREVNGLMTLSLVLAQRLQRADVIKGKIKLNLKGVQDDKGVNLNIINQFKLDDAFEFKYFQVKKYAFTLPKGFIPTSLLVELIPSNKRQKTVSTQFEWSKIIENKQKELVDSPETKNN